MRGSRCPFCNSRSTQKTLRECGVVGKSARSVDDAFVANALGFLDDGRDDALALLDRFKRDLEGFHRKNGNDVSDSDVSDDDDDEEEEDQEARRDGVARKRRPVKSKTETRRKAVPEPFNIARSRPRPAPGRGQSRAVPKLIPCRSARVESAPPRNRSPFAERRRVTGETSPRHRPTAVSVSFLPAPSTPSNVEKVRAEMKARKSQRSKPSEHP